jgi:chromosome segregation ATPase
MMQALDEAQAARRVALEAWQQQVAGLVARVESISPAAEGAAQELERTEGEWAALATEPAFELEPDSVARFEGAAGRARSGIAEQQRMEAERRAEDDRRAALHASRAEMIQHVESIRGEDALERIEQATREWEALGAAEDDAAMGALGTQFESAVAAARQRHQNQLDMQQTHARLAELASEAERLSGEESPAREAWTTATAEWTALVARSEGLDEAIRSATSRPWHASRSAPKSSTQPRSGRSVSSCSASSS